MLDSAGREPEVINFGVSGYGTAQELLMLRIVYGSIPLILSCWQL